MILGDGGGFALYTLLVVSPTKGTHAHWKWVGVAPDQLVVAVLEGRRLSQVVSLTARIRWSRFHHFVAMREADVGARGVAIRRWSQPSSRPPRLGWRLHS